MATSRAAATASRIAADAQARGSGGFSMRMSGRCGDRSGGAESLR
jgi:hypothetical protein